MVSRRDESDRLPGRACTRTRRQASVSERINFRSIAEAHIQSAVNCSARAETQMGNGNPSAAALFQIATGLLALASVAAAVAHEHFRAPEPAPEEGTA